MQALATRPWITTGIALTGAGLIAATPVPRVLAADIALTAEDITLDFVRHGQSTDNVNGILGTVPPGAHLTDTGQDQADAVASEIQQEFPGGIDGIYASELVRTQETAAPLADALGMNVTVLPGLNEINAGILEGTDYGRIGELLYIAAPFLWTLGYQNVPQWGSDIDPNGFAFDDRFSDAVQTIYADSIADPDAADTDVAFSHAAAIMTWVLMNVKNPNPLLMFEQPLDNTGEVEISGNPEDGWTLESWNGEEVPESSLASELFVDFRDVILAEQTAVYNIEQAFDSGDATEIWPAIQTGFTNFGDALFQFPIAVYEDLADAFAWM